MWILYPTLLLILQDCFPLECSSHRYLYDLLFNSFQISVFYDYSLEIITLFIPLLLHALNPLSFLFPLNMYFYFLIHYIFYLCVDSSPLRNVDWMRTNIFPYFVYSKFLVAITMANSRHFVKISVDWASLCFLCYVTFAFLPKLFFKFPSFNLLSFGCKILERVHVFVCICRKGLTDLCTYLQELPSFQCFQLSHLNPQSSLEPPIPKTLMVSPAV